ncbi:MAG: hypothetical protein SPF74_09580 [Candidatus Limivicinus sp.]|nr:hypothetical protein [Candidatus Limivicinus sp.]
MKTKRFVSTLLALLLVCSLPVSAFAADNYEIMSQNTGTVETNYAAILTNNGVVEINEGGIDSNLAGGEYPGTVKINNGKVAHNVGTVEENNGKVNINHEGGTVTTNNGTVSTNEGTVETNNGTVVTNDGTVETNTTTGTVSNRSGTVTTNYGTVNKLEWVNGIGFVPTSTWYGVQVDNDGTEIGEQYCKPDEVLDFSQLTKEGYVYAGYTQEYQLLDGVLTKQALTVSDTSYTVTCPNVLTPIWQAIASPAADDGAGYFGPGSHISINGRQYLLVAVVEDVYCLASVDSFEEEQLSDLPALLATLLTEEQLTHVTGEPELLDEELTARFFAGAGSHIVFPCDSSLIFH